MTKLALITGASRGLGAALAEALAPDHHILAVARTVGALEDLDDAEGIFLPPRTCGGVAFRTGVSAQLGLFAALSADGSTAHGVRLLAPLPR